MNRTEGWIRDGPFAGLTAASFRWLRTDGGSPGISGQTCAIIETGRPAAHHRRGNSAGQQFPSEGDARPGPIATNEFAMAVIQPDTKTEIRSQRNQIGIAIAIDIHGKNIEDRMARMEIQPLASSRQRNMDERRALPRIDVSAIHAAVAIEVSAAETGRIPKANRTDDRAGSLWVRYTGQK